MLQLQRGATHNTASFYLPSRVLQSDNCCRLFIIINGHECPPWRIPKSTTSQAIVDDRDPRIVFTGNWFLNGVSQEYNTSKHGTTSTGAKAEFSFNGTSVAVYGTVPITDNNGPSVSTFTLDDNSPVKYTAQKTTTTQFQTQYYQSGLISDGEHKLTVTNTSPKPAFFWIDYILYSPSSGNLTSGSGSSKTQINAGAIAGGVTGGVALIAALVLFYFLFYRRRKRGGVFEYRTVNPKDILEAETIESPQSGRPPTIVPFIPLEVISQLPSGDPDPSTNRISFGSSDHVAATSAHRHEHPPPSPLPAIPTPTMVTNSQNRRPLRKGAGELPAPASNATPIPRLHEDGGVRLQGGPSAPDQENLTDVPPVYKQY